MRLKTISDRYKNYLKKVRKEPECSVSVYVFYGDKETEGNEQLIYQTGHVYDENFGENDVLIKCKEMYSNGWRNIFVERRKSYYVRTKEIPFGYLMSFLANKYKLIE